MSSNSSPKPDNHVIVLFGATGDLARRKLLPGLFHLHVAGLLPKEYRIIGASPAQYALTDAQFREHAEQACSDFCITKPTDRSWPSFAERLSFGAADPGKSTALVEAVQGAEKEIPAPVRRLYHLAVPPAAFTSVVGMLGATGLASGARVIVEKPFGTDLASARRLNQAVLAVFDESQVFRIDHFLARSRSTTSSRSGSRTGWPSRSGTASTSGTWRSTRRKRCRSRGGPRLQQHLLRIDVGRQRRNKRWRRRGRLRNRATARGNHGDLRRAGLRCNGCRCGDYRCGDSRRVGHRRGHALRRAGRAERYKCLTKYDQRRFQIGHAGGERNRSRRQRGLQKKPGFLHGILDIASGQILVEAGLLRQHLRDRLLQFRRQAVRPRDDAKIGKQRRQAVLLGSRARGRRGDSDLLKRRQYIPGKRHTGRRTRCGIDRRIGRTALRVSADGGGRRPARPPRA